MKNALRKIVFSFLALVLFNGLKAQYIHSITTNNDDVFICTTTGIYQLTDSCKTWTPLNNGMGEINTFHLVISNNIMYAGTQNQGLFISKDYGKNWTPANAGLPTATADPKTYAGIYSLAVEGNKVALVLVGVGAFISSDNAATWTKATPAKEGLYFSKVAILNGNVFAAVGIDKTLEPYMSADDGMTWKKINKGLEYTYIRSIAACGSSILVGGIGGINSYSPETKKWKEIASVSDADQISVNGRYVVAGNTSNVSASADSGKTWRNIDVKDVSAEYGKIAITPTAVYYLNFGVFTFTTDDGAHWTGAKKGENVAVAKKNSSGGSFAYKPVGTQNGVTLSATEHSGVIFKVENTNAYSIDVNIKISFNCKSSNPFGGVSYQTSEIVWRISCPANSTRSYDDSPAACQVGGCADDTQSWEIVTWTVTN
jgi:photosystem II stability/assembly factor-like uncharacterized protein